MLNKSLNIKTLELRENLLQKLINNNINTIEDIWRFKKEDLRDIGFSLKEIGEITTKLQLLGLDLNKKVY